MRRRVRVGELVERHVVELNDGYRVKNEELGERGIPFVRGGDIWGGVVNVAVEDHVRPEFADRLNGKHVRPGDVAFITKGTVGRVGRVLEGSPPFVVAPQVCFWRSLDPDQVDPGFLYYLLCGREFQSALDGVKTHGSMVADYVSLSDQMSFHLTLPAPDEQRSIAQVLGALDEKIELNRAANETLEAMARAIFKSWFVDFDPVRAKHAGKAPVGLDVATAALFPGGFEKSDLGEVPRGWRVGAYGAGLTVVRGKSYKSDELQSSGTALVTLKSFLRGGGYREDGLKEYVGEYKPEQVVRPGEVVVAFTDVTQAAEVIGRPARVRADARYSTLVASLDVGIVRPKVPELPPEYLYYCFREPSFTDHTYAHANGSTVLHLAAGAVEKYEGLWPDARVASSFVEIVRPLIQRQDANWAECDTHANLRDLLLPKLLSGEIRVRDADRIVDRAV